MVTDAIVFLHSTRLIFNLAALQLVNRCGGVVGNMSCFLCCSTRLFFSEISVCIGIEGFGSSCFFRGFLLPTVKIDNLGKFKAKRLNLFIAHTPGSNFAGSAAADMCNVCDGTFQDRYLQRSMSEVSSRNRTCHCAVIQVYVMQVTYYSTFDPDPQHFLGFRKSK